jgi:CubicO group peptidase (beta-lactamase class C family)
MRLARPLLLIAALGVAAATFPPEAEQVYLARFKDITTNGRGELSRYEPLEAVRGVARHRPLPVAATPTIAPAALTAARAYAAANNSSAFMVWHDGKVQEAAYFGGRGAGTPIVSKSLAKPLTAIAVGRAIALGKIRSLDQPVVDFIPEWRGTPKAPIRMRHLLDMRSGLLAQGFSMDPANPWSRAYLHPYHERIIVEEYPLTDPPGTKYEYNNATSELVALVIERATGMRYADFIGREVLQPIGAQGGEVWVNRPGGLAHSGCCIMLPPETWLRLGILLLDEGAWGGKRLLPKGYVRAMRTPTAENPYYGLGLWVSGRYTERRGFANPARPGPKVLHSEPYLADDIFMFDGNSNQIVYMIPSERLIVLRTGDTPPKSPEWDNSKLPNIVLRGLDGRKAKPQPR